MPRTSRSVAQRLASQTKSKKRRSPRTGTPSQEAAPAAAPREASESGPSMAEILDEVVPSEGGSRAESMSAFGPATTNAPTANRPATGRPATRRTAPRAAIKPVPTRRRYREYAAEYQYVWSDLHRILIVATSLIVLLVVLWFVLE